MAENIRTEIVYKYHPKYVACKNEILVEIVDLSKDAFRFPLREVGLGQFQRISSEATKQLLNLK